MACAFIVSTRLLSAASGSPSAFSKGLDSEGVVVNGVAHRRMVYA